MSRTFIALSQAGMERRVAALEALYAPDYFHTNPDGSLMDRAAVLASYRAPTSVAITGSRRADERVQVHGDGAVVSLRLTLTGTRDGAGFESRYRVTYVLRKTGGRWQVTNSHATLLAS